MNIFEKNKNSLRVIYKRKSDGFKESPENNLGNCSGSDNSLTYYDSSEDDEYESDEYEEDYDNSNNEEFCLEKMSTDEIILDVPVDRIYVEKIECKKINGNVLKSTDGFFSCILSDEGEPPEHVKIIHTNNSDYTCDVEFREIVYIKVKFVPVETIKNKTSWYKFVGRLQDGTEITPVLISNKYGWSSNIVTKCSTWSRLATDHLLIRFVSDQNFRNSALEYMKNIHIKKYFTVKDKKSLIKKTIKKIIDYDSEEIDYRDFYDEDTYPEIRFLRTGSIFTIKKNSENNSEYIELYSPDYFFRI